MKTNSINNKNLELEFLQKLSKELFASQLFDAKNASQILAKILIGREVGLEPIASVIGIAIVSGKPVMGANLIATLIDRHPDYNYKIIKNDNTICEIEISDGKSVIKGKCSFTIEEAKNAGLAGKDVWKKYTSDMLFARAISRASRRFAAGIFGGAPVYTPDELNVDTDEDGHVFDTEKSEQKEKEVIVDPRVSGLVKEFYALIESLGMTDEAALSYCASKGLSKIEELPSKVIEKWVGDLKQRIEQKNTETNKQEPTEEVK